MTVKISIPASVIMAGSVGRQTIGSLGSSEDSTNGSWKNPSFSERHPKVVRSLTVVAYIFCVSLAAILLSAYYVVIWTPAATTESSKIVNVNTTLLPCRYYPGSEGEEPGQYRIISQHSSSYRRSPHRAFVPRPVTILNTHSLLPKPASLKQEQNGTNRRNETVDSETSGSSSTSSLDDDGGDGDSDGSKEFTISSPGNLPETTAAPPASHVTSHDKHHLSKRFVPNETSDEVVGDDDDDDDDAPKNSDSIILRALHPKGTW